MAPLAKGAFAKLCNLYFYGFVKDGKEVSRPDPNRAQESNLIATFLFPRKRKCQLSTLVAVLEGHDDEFYKKSGALIKKAVKTWYRHAESARVELYKIVNADEREIPDERLPVQASNQHGCIDDFPDIEAGVNELEFNTGKGFDQKKT